MSILFGPEEKPFQSSKKRSKQSANSARSSENKTEDLLVFGYECKFFRDDVTAKDVNSGKTLIPWMGNKDLMIDRYDCRGHLYKLEDFDFSNSSKQLQLSTEEIDIESILDEERYKDLNYDTAEDEILEEEAEKRSKSLYDPYTAYQSINYSYGDTSSGGKSLSDIDNTTDNTFKQYCQYYGYDANDQQVKAYFEAYQKQQQYESSRPPPPPPPNPPTAIKKNVAEEKPEPFLPPEGIEIPTTIELPETRRMQSIIEKTASFLSKQSSQMEIVLKTKQSGNPQFGFLNFDHYLNPFYKFILGKIKDGSYVPNLSMGKEENAKSENKEESSQPETKKEEDRQDETGDKGDNEKSDNSDDSDDSDDESGDEGELHPLLQAHRRPVSKPDPPPSQPKKVETEPEPAPVERKPLGRPEDLAKIYMSMKYKSNPEPEKMDVEESKKEHEQSQQYYLQQQQNQAPPPPPAPQQETVYSNQMVDYRQRPPPPPPPTMFGQGMMVPPPFQQRQPPIGNNFRMHPQAFPPGMPPMGAQPPPMMHQGAPPQHPMPPPPQPLMPPGVEGIDMFPSGNQPMRPPLMNQRPPHPLHGPPPPFAVPPGPPLRTPGPPPTSTINNQSRSFANGSIGPQLPPKYTQRSVGPTPGPRPPPPQQELLPPGVDEVENSLPPPPPLPFTPNIAEISKIATTKQNQELKKTEETKEAQPRDAPRDSSKRHDDDVQRHRDTTQDYRNHRREFQDDDRDYRDEDRDYGDEDRDYRDEGRDYRDNDRDYRNDDRDYRDDDRDYRDDVRDHRESDREYHDENRDYRDEDRDYRYSDQNYEETITSESSRYRPSEMLSSILKSSGITPSTASDSPVRNDEEDSHRPTRLHQKHFPSSLYQDSPTRSPARDYYDSPRSGYDSPAEPFSQTEGISPFARLSVSLKMLQQHTSSPEEQHDHTDQHTFTAPVQPCVEPSADLRPVIERLAQYVAKNGDEFEKGIREKKDPRFDFLNHWNMYHGYYLETKKKAKEEMEKEQEEELERRKNLKVKFGLKSTKPVKSAMKCSSGSHSSAAAIFNQHDDDDVTDEPVNSGNTGFKPKKDTDGDNLRNDEQMYENRSRDHVFQSSPFSKITPKQQAALKRKAQTESIMKKDDSQVDPSNLPRSYRDGASSRREENNGDYTQNVKRKYKDSSSSLGKTELMSKKKDAFHQAINDAFKSNS